ncbi:hypothetical protein FPOAC2_09788 [Fusarium poae]
MKNTAFATEHGSKNRIKNKCEKSKRCIKQEACHHEVHHHHDGKYTIKCNDKCFKPGKHNKDDKDDKKNKIVKTKSKADKDFSNRANKVIEKWANRDSPHNHDHDDFPLDPQNIPTLPDTRKRPGRPRQDSTRFINKVKSDHKQKSDNEPKSDNKPECDNKPKSDHKVVTRRRQLPPLQIIPPQQMERLWLKKHEKRHARGQVFAPPYPFSMEEVMAIKKVNVTIEQNGKDPIAINVIIRNNSEMNVTIMTRNSPVDKDAFKLGHFRVYPDETQINFAPKKEEYEWYHRPKGKFSRLSDPRKEYLESDLTHLRPNETVKQTIIIPSGNKEEKEKWLKMLKLSKKIKMRVEGKWFAIGAWDKEPRWSRNVDFNFVSNTIDLEIPRDSKPNWGPGRVYTGQMADR